MSEADVVHAESKNFWSRLIGGALSHWLPDHAYVHSWLILKPMHLGRIVHFFTNFGLALPFARDFCGGSLIEIDDSGVLGCITAGLGRHQIRLKCGSTSRQHSFLLHAVVNSRACLL
jgi:hypothetical protein